MIVNQHENQHEYAASERALNAQADRIAAQRRADALFVGRRNRCRQSSRAQHKLELTCVAELYLRIVRAEGDLRVTAGDRTLNHGRALCAAVQNDGEAALYVGAGNALENA